MPAPPGTWLVRALAVVVATAIGTFASSGLARDLPDDPVEFDVMLLPTVELNGYSGALRALVALPGETLSLPLDWGVAPPPEAWYRWLPFDGAGSGAEFPLAAGALVRAPGQPGSYRLQIGWDTGARSFDDFALHVQVPISEKQGPALYGYRIGSYPSGTGRYAPPAGFIMVTPQNRGLAVSRSFTVEQFLTKDQQNVWPKFVLIDPLLLDKLELVLAELRAQGVRADGMHVMSGYRTPQYNRQGAGRGRAALSRHQYGDAADVWVENADAPGRMADLNGDGRSDVADVRVLLAAVDRVEARFPELVGGAGIYRSSRVRGPYLHIDVRGTRSRW